MYLVFTFQIRYSSFSVRDRFLGEDIGVFSVHFSNKVLVLFVQRLVYFLLNEDIIARISSVRKFVRDRLPVGHSRLEIGFYDKDINISSIHFSLKMLVFLKRIPVYPTDCARNVSCVFIVQKKHNFLS